MASQKALIYKKRELTQEFMAECQSITKKIRAEEDPGLRSVLCDSLDSAAANLILNLTAIEREMKKNSEKQILSQGSMPSHSLL